MNFLNNFTIKSRTYALVALSVVVALTLSLVSHNGFNIIQTQLDELIKANTIERDTYRAILEEKNYLLNSNGSVRNHENANQAFINAGVAIQNIHKTLDTLNKTNEGMQQTIKGLKTAIAEYDVYYNRGVYLLNELELERDNLQMQGDTITLLIQQYVEAKREDVNKELSKAIMEKINTGSNIWQYTYVMRADEKLYILSPQDSVYKQLQKDYKIIIKELEHLKAISNQEFEKQKIETFYIALQNYDEAMKNWVQYNKELVTIILPKTKELGDIIVVRTLEIAQNTLHSIDKKRENVMHTLLIVTFMAIVLGLIFGSMISRSISSVLLHFQTGLLDFFSYLDRHKNSSSQIKINSKDEIGLMAQVVNEHIVKIEDVMEKKLEQLKEKDEQMLQQSRLAQMGEMISMIAHQWRQPLNAIAATSGDIEVKLFQRRMFDLNVELQREEMQAYTLESLHKINSFVQYLSKTIDDFRNFFKPDKKESYFRLEDLMGKTLNLSAHLIRTHGIIVIKNYDSNLQKMKNYDNEITQVLLNILKNAIDAIVENQIQKPRLYITIKKNRVGNQSISIEDNAGGINESIIEKIFNPYFSTKDKNGTGLGLYMSKIIIHEHCHGELSVVNSEFGACFTIEFLPQEENTNEV
ncbi:MAG: ATP-binding protein [Sulfurimonas sp.]|nr:ATP-binding protein [Sulfurimonas sp.]MBU3937893.1 ATP-binding protein [bacterium]MBU4025338.1 ATP-binding protein [bacterium]